jgi:hypothetical protein
MSQQNTSMGGVNSVMAPDYVLTAFWLQIRIYILLLKTMTQTSMIILAPMNSMFSRTLIVLMKRLLVEPFLPIPGLNFF